MTLILAAIIVCMSAAPAHADPGTIGLLILSALELSAIAKVTFLGVSIAQAVGTVLLVAGAVGLNLLINRRPTPSSQPSALAPPDAGHQTIKQSIPPRVVGYGRVRLAGSYMLYEEDSGTSYDVIAFHHGRVEAIVGYYLHDDAVTIDGSGVVNVLPDGRYDNDKITIKTRLGAETETAYSEITSALSSIWTSAHRGDGIASAAMICSPVALEDYTVEYPRGLPMLSIVADCTPMFDWRDDTQDRDDSSTWATSSNPVVQLVDLLTSAEHGMGEDWDTLIAPVLDQLTIRADICDEIVALADGTGEPRYRSNGSFALDSDPADRITSILDTCDGWISENGDGTLALEVGQYRAPRFTIGSRHVKGYALQYGFADEEAVNEIVFDYTETALDYKTTPGQPWRDETDISARGRVRPQRLALPWVYSHSQGRRLAKRRMARFQAGMHGTITTTLYGIQGLGERWIRIVAPEVHADLADAVIENRGATVDLQSARVTYRFVIVNPNAIDAWDEAAEEGSPPEIPEKLVKLDPPVPTIDSVSFVADPAPFPNYFVRIEDPGRADLTYQVRARATGATDWIVGPDQDASSVGGGLVEIAVSFPSLLFASPVDIQVISHSPTASSAWSSTFVYSA